MIKTILTTVISVYFLLIFVFIIIPLPNFKKLAFNLSYQFKDLCFFLVLLIQNRTFDDMQSLVFLTNFLPVQAHIYWMITRNEWKS